MGRQCIGLVAGHGDVRVHEVDWCHRGGDVFAQRCWLLQGTRLRGKPPRGNEEGSEWQVGAGKCWNSCSRMETTRDKRARLLQARMLDFSAITFIFVIIVKAFEMSGERCSALRYSCHLRVAAIRLICSRESSGQLQEVRRTGGLFSSEVA